MTVGRFDTSPMAIVRSFWRNRQLIWQMTRREVIGRYRGSIMGLAWSFFNPVLMLIVYTFVFSVVFKARWGVASEDTKAGFALILFVGLIVHGLLAECVNRAPTLVLANPNYVKKVVFPLEILVFVSMGSTLFHVAVSLAVFLVAFVLVHGYLYWTAFLVPIVLLPLVILTLGAAWFLAALGVYARDVGQATSIITTVAMFLAPVFYPVTALPEESRWWLMINPLTVIIEQARGVLFWGQLPDWPSLALYAVASAPIAYIGFWWFQRVRKGFADVL